MALAASSWTGWTGTPCLSTATRTSRSGRVRRSARRAQEVACSAARSGGNRRPSFGRTSRRSRSSRSCILRPGNSVSFAFASSLTPIQADIPPCSRHSPAYLVHRHRQAQHGRSHAASAPARLVRLLLLLPIKGADSRPTQHRALTIHKSQGQSLDAVGVRLTSTFEKGQ